MEIVTKCEKEHIGEGYNYEEAKYMCMCAEQEKIKELEQPDSPMKLFFEKMIITRLTARRGAGSEGLLFSVRLCV